MCCDSGPASAPPPDPALAQAQIKSMGYQDQAVQQMMDNNASMAPLQKEQMQWGLDTAKTAYGQSQDDRSWMLNRRGSLGTLQDQQVADAASFNAPGRQEQLAQQAGEDVSGAYAGMRGQTERALAARGISANSGAALAASAGMGNSAAMASAAAINKTRIAARAEGYGLTDRANNSLAGYPSMGMAATGAGAGYGASGLATANNGLAGMNAGYSAVGQAAGAMGANAGNMYNNEGNYQIGVSKAQGDGGAGMVVGLASAAAVAF